MVKKCAKTPSTKKSSVLCVNDYWRHKPDSGVFGSGLSWCMVKHIIRGTKQADRRLHLLWCGRSSMQWLFWSVHVSRKVWKKNWKIISRSCDKGMTSWRSTYEQEFTHILNLCNPLSTRLIIFQWRLRPKIY